MHIYFSGIGGVGIGPLALLALDSGYEVSGSDLKSSEMVNLLENRGVAVVFGQSGSEIAQLHASKPIEWFVYSSALPPDHPELIFAKQNNIKISKRDEFLNQILDEKDLQLIAVAGTHGKTTTTGMLIWAFKSLDLPVSYSIGTTIDFGPPAQYVPNSKYFIYECDEFDKNFLNFKPAVSVITSYDYDHAETYPTKKDYQAAFIQFIKQSKISYLWQRDAQVLELSPSQNIVVVAEDSNFSDLHLPGRHMKQNAFLAATCLRGLLPEHSNQTIFKALSAFPGSSRRFEKLAENLYTDYAHHPTEIAATLQLAQEINPVVVVIYQPHQNLRQQEIIKDGGYQTSFSAAKTVYWLPTYLSRENPALPVLKPQELIATTSNPEAIIPAAMNDELWQKVEGHRANGDLVLAMGAGDLDSWLREKVSTAK